MRIKKLLAGVLAGAMVVGCMVMPTGASVTYTSEITSMTATITYDVASNAWFDDSDEYGQVFVCDWSSSNTVINALYFELDDGTTVTVTGVDFDDYVTVIGEGAVVDDYTSVVSFTYEFTLDPDEVENGNASSGWLGGGFGVNSESTDWASISWGNSTSQTLNVKDTAVKNITLTTEITEDDLAYSGYIVTLANSDSETATVDYNTYFVDGSSYYIGIDVSDVPYDQELSITNVEFY